MSDNIAFEEELMKVRLMTAFLIFFFFLGTGMAQEGSQVSGINSGEITAVNQNKITLDIKGMDVVDVLKMLATRSGMNVVVGKNVTGRVTLFLKDVDVWDVFEIILSSNDLAYEKTGGIINVMTQQDYLQQYGERYKDKKEAKTIQLKYAKASNLVTVLNQIKTNIGKVVADENSNTITIIETPEKIKEMLSFVESTDLPVQTRVFVLNYAQVEKISPKIQEIISKGAGSIKIDERTNKIAVTDYPEKLDEIGKIITAFDEKTPQVLIDAQIVELSPSDKLEMGVDFDTWIKKNFKISSALPVGTAGKLILGTADIAPTGKGDYKAILNLLRTIGDTKVLSSPRIMALNNQEAKILVGTKDAYITSTTSQGGSGATVTSQSVNFVDVGIKLYVTPVINRDNFVTMKIRPEISSSERVQITSEGQITEVPIVTTSETETTVMVKDGITIIIGGLRKDQRTKTVKKIPVLGDIPGVGFFFRNTSDEVTKTDLVILLTPHIMSGESSFADFSEIKPKDGVILRMAGGNILSEKVASTEAAKASRDDIFEYYDSVLEKARKAALSARPQGETGEIEVYFTISSSGKLKGEPKLISSTNDKLNKAALECIESASPYPAFPEKLKKNEEEFRVIIEYE